MLDESKGSLLLFDIVSTTFIPGLVGKMVSKLRSDAELRAFYGRLFISGIDNKLNLSSSVQTGATAVRAPLPITCSVEMRYLPLSLRPAKNLKPSQMVSTGTADFLTR